MTEEAVRLAPEESRLWSSTDKTFDEFMAWNHPPFGVEHAWAAAAKGGG